MKKGTSLYLHLRTKNEDTQSFYQMLSNWHISTKVCVDPDQFTTILNKTEKNKSIIYFVLNGVRWIIVMFLKK